jgi:hypothetical protein
MIVWCCPAHKGWLLPVQCKDTKLPHLNIHIANTHFPPRSSLLDTTHSMADKLMTTTNSMLSETPENHLQCM